MEAVRGRTVTDDDAGWGSALLDADIGLAEVSLEGHVLRANRHLGRIVAQHHEALLGRRFTDLVHPEDRHHVGGPATPGADTMRDPAARPIRLDPDTVPRERETFVRISSLLVEDEFGEPLHYAVQVADITDLVLAERTRHEHETQLRTILEMAEEGIVALDEDRRVVFANRRLAELLGRDVDDLMDTTVEALLPGLDVIALEEEDGVDAVRRFESPLLRADGDSLWVIVSSRSYRWAHSDRARYVVMVTDVSELKAAERELLRRSTHDSLTGLANRTLVDDWSGSNTGTASQAVIYVDLDGFKAINDTHGHAVGDDVLVAVAERLRAQVRSTDLVARLGGDEFVVVCRDTAAADAAELAHRIVRSMSTPIELDGGLHEVSASAGLAIGAADVAHQGLLRRADAALYRAKRSGGDRVAV